MEKEKKLKENIENNLNSEMEKNVTIDKFPVLETVEEQNEHNNHDNVIENNQKENEIIENNDKNDVEENNSTNNTFNSNSSNENNEFSSLFKSEEGEVKETVASLNIGPHTLRIKDLNENILLCYEGSRPDDHQLAFVFRGLQVGHQTELGCFVASFETTSSFFAHQHLKTSPLDSKRN